MGSRRHQASEYTAAELAAMARGVLQLPGGDRIGDLDADRDGSEPDAELLEDLLASARDGVDPYAYDEA